MTSKLLKSTWSWISRATTTPWKCNRLEMNRRPQRTACQGLGLMEIAAKSTCRAALKHIRSLNAASHEPDDTFHSFKQKNFQRGSSKRVVCPTEVTTTSGPTHPSPFRSSLAMALRPYTLLWSRGLVVRCFVEGALLCISTCLTCRLVACNRFQRWCSVEAVYSSWLRLFCRYGH